MPVRGDGSLQGVCTDRAVTPVSYFASVADEITLTNQGRFISPHIYGV